MYSPKIREDLVRELFLLKCELGKPMTKITNSILEQAIKKEKRRIIKQKEVKSC